MLINEPLRTGGPRRTAVFVIFIALLLAACAPSSAETRAASTPQSGPTAAAAPSTAAPSTTAPPAREPSATITHTATATAIPSPRSSPTPTLLPGMLQVSAGRIQVPILLYHHISDRPGERYVIPTRTFRAQMKLLYEQGYQTIGVSQLADAVRHGGTLPEKAVVITFDDGYLDTHTHAFPILQEFGFSGVTYIITSTLEKDKSYGYMQERELKELLAAGWEIGSHSVTHYDLKKTKIGAGNEVRQSKETLEVLLGVPVRSFCYPYGVANPSLKDLVQDSGYDSAVGLGILQTHTPERLYYLSRLEVHRSTSLSDFRALLEPRPDEAAANETFQKTPAAP